MSTVRMIASVSLLLTLFAAPQSFSQIQSLGDVAREQKEVRKQRQKNGETAKTLTNDDIAPGTRALTLGMAGSPDLPQAQDPQSKESSSAATTKCEPTQADANKNNPTSCSSVAPVLDRPKDSTADVIIVPAGTELTVDLDSHKTVVPVRVGFATPIPALSQVTVEVSRTSFAIPYFDAGTPYAGIPYASYAEYATITAVTVAGRTYPVQTDSMPLQIGGTNSELTFTLGGPVEILR